MKRLDDGIKNELWELIQEDKGVFFLGQDYQKTYFDSDYFCNEIYNKICHKRAESSSYTDLWHEMCRISGGKEFDENKSFLNEEQKLTLAKISAGLPESDKLKKVLGTGWASIITSSVDDGIMTRGGLSKFTPIYDVRTRKAGLGNKKNVHITYLFGCVKEPYSLVDSYDITPDSLDNASEMLKRVKKDSIPYSGAFVVDGWNVDEDWFDAIELFSSFDWRAPYPKIYLFSMSEDDIDVLTTDRAYKKINALFKNGQVYYSTYSFYDNFIDFFTESSEEDDDESSEETVSISFSYNKKNIDINIPNSAISSLDINSVHVLLPEDRHMISMDKLLLRNLTISFLATSYDSLPIWQGYLQGCYINRDIYYTEEKDDDHKYLKNTVDFVLNTGNLHQISNTIILVGPSNSGKSTLLGKLAIDYSKTNPVIFIKGNLPISESSTNRYDHFVQFVNNYIVKPCRDKRIKRRVVIIWDNNLFVDKIHDYLMLAKELSESNAILICSSYGREGAISRKKHSPFYIDINPNFNPQTELKDFSKMLNNNLGSEFARVLDNIKIKGKNTKSAYRITENGTQILFLIQKIFQRSDESLRRISSEATIKLAREINSTSSSIEEYLQESIEKIITNAENKYEREVQGLQSLAEFYFNNDQQKEKWFEEVYKCAPTLNDILALAGQFGIRLPVNLVYDVLADICPGVRFYINDVDELLQKDSMLEVPFPIDEYGREMVGYRSINEAETYLDTHYQKRGSKDLQESNDIIYREDREIALLEKIIQYADLGYHYHGEDLTYARNIKDLIDYFCPNSPMGKDFSDNYSYKYNELANCMMQYGGENNPEIALTAAHLLREQFGKILSDQVISYVNVTKEQKAVLDIAAKSLQKAIETEKNTGNSDSARLMRLYIECCANRNYVLNREAPSQDDLTLFRQLRSYFNDALKIYLSNPVGSRTYPGSMLDVYLNLLDYYHYAMDTLYGVSRDTDHCPENAFDAYNQELAYAMTMPIGKLADVEVLRSKPNVARKLQNVYTWTNKSMKKIETIARAKGITTFTYLKARLTWILDANEIEEIRSSETNLVDESFIKKLNGDMYLYSDWNNENTNAPAEVNYAAKKVYDYLMDPAIYPVIIAKDKNGNRSIECLEMLIRAAWIVKTHNLPYTWNQCPKLTVNDWKELHTYCDYYIRCAKKGTPYGFAYYLEGIYLYVFTADKGDTFFNEKKESDQMFDYCIRSCYKPKELRSFSDSYFILGSQNTGKPVILEAQITRKYGNRLTADIISYVDPNDQIAYPFLKLKRNLYCAPTLSVAAISTAQVQSVKIALRFNLQGALAGPTEGR